MLCDMIWGPQNTVKIVLLRTLIVIGSYRKPRVDNWPCVVCVVRAAGKLIGSRFA